MEKTKAADESNDRKYFIQVPQLVFALCRTPYDFTLWNVIKMIAGETSECILSTSDLADLAMMSTGKVSDSRAYLIEVGLLKGKCYREKGYPQPVWHLRIPDIWLENIKWRQLYDSLKDRIELKKTLKQLFDEAGIFRSFNSTSFNIRIFQDVNVKSLHNMKPLQKEPSQYEGKPSQYETKKNQERKTNLKDGASAASNPSFKKNALPPKTELSNHFQELTGIPSPTRKTDVGFYWSSVQEILTLAGKDVEYGQRLIKESVEKLRQDNLTISGPNSLIKTIRALIGEHKSNQQSNGGSLPADWSEDKAAAFKKLIKNQET